MRADARGCGEGRSRISRGQKRGYEQLVIRLDTRPNRRLSVGPGAKRCQPVKESKKKRHRRMTLRMSGTKLKTRWGGGHHTGSIRRRDQSGLQVCKWAPAAGDNHLDVHGYIIGIYRILNGLLFISGLRGLMGRANRSSSFASSASVPFPVVPGAMPPPTSASREATPPPPESETAEPPTLVAGGETEVTRGCVRGTCALFAAGRRLVTSP